MYRVNYGYGEGSSQSFAELKDAVAHLNGITEGRDRCTLEQRVKGQWMPIEVEGV